MTISEYLASRLPAGVTPEQPDMSHWEDLVERGWATREDVDQMAKDLAAVKFLRSYIPR